MNVSPKLSSIIFGVWTLLSAIVALGASAIPSYVPHEIAMNVVQTAAYISALISALATGSSLFASKQPGPLSSDAKKTP